VLISYLSEHSDAEQTIDLVRESGRAGIAIAGDISHEDHCRQIVERAVKEFGKIDILVNNAAYQQTYESIEKLPSNEWEYTFRTNIDAMYYF
jgi:NAD(P)-dependent dehydrogenase (short-subunit alcohol dehydrogenase family)